MALYDSALFSFPFSLSIAYAYFATKIESNLNLDSSKKKLTGIQIEICLHFGGITCILAIPIHNEDIIRNNCSSVLDRTK